MLRRLGIFAIAFLFALAPVLAPAAEKQGFSSSVTITRAANTTAYSAGTVIKDVNSASAALSFNSIGPDGVEVMLTTARFEIDVASVPSGMTSFNLCLYSVTPPSALADGATWDIPSGDRASFKGCVSLGTPVDQGSTLYVETNGINKQLAVPAGTTLYAYLVTNGGYTPGSGDVLKVFLHFVSL